MKVRDVMKKSITKYSICFIFLLTITLGSLNSVMAANNIKMSLENKEIEFKDTLESPYLDSNNRTMIPLRTIAEELGHKVEWIQDIKTIAIDDNIYITIPDDDIYTIIEDGDIFIKSSGKRITMDTVATVKNNKTYVPARFIIEALGHKLEYKYYNGIHKMNVLKNQGSIGSTTTQAKEFYFGYIRDLNLYNNQATFEMMDIIGMDDIKIFPELGFDREYFENIGYDFLFNGNMETFELKDSTEYKILNWSDSEEENIPKSRFIELYNDTYIHNGHVMNGYKYKGYYVHDGYFYIEVKNNYIEKLHEVYHP